MRRARLLGCVLLVAIAATAVGTAAARVPQGFVGMNLGPYSFAPALDPNRQFDRMVGSGVESVRVVFSWKDAQPYASLADVPPDQAGDYVAGAGGVPTSFGATDEVMTLAASHGLTVLPVVIYTPRWEERPHPAADFGLPKSNAVYADYVALLVRRYGPRGAFWSEHRELPYLPIHAWQIWNEPNTRTRWPIQPFARTYVAMVRAARSAIRRADPGAKIVLAGMPNYSWRGLEKIYRVPGARRLFDVVAIHPYTASPQGVLTILRRARAVMRRHRDGRKPLLATETGWPSSFGHSPEHYPFDTTPSGQARKLATLLPLLARNRRALGLAGFDFYAWLDTDSGHSFNFSGLLRLRGSTITAKPAFAAFRRRALALDGCRVKGALATVCARRR
jgi:hypothetical protein